MSVPVTQLSRRVRRRLSGREMVLRAATAAAAIVAAVGIAGGAASGRGERRDVIGPTCGAPLTDEQLAGIAPPPVTREMRGAWVSPVEGGEWPSRPGMSPEAQRAELLAVFDRAVALGLNTVVLHVRVAADAMYPTSRAPWSSYLTRARGSAAAPGYDPLAFAVGEAHRRGLQLHAWFNPFRAAPPEGGTVRPGAAFIAREHPEWIVRYGSQTWIDPGYPAARRSVLDAMLEVVDRYDVDAIHIDDYFYPYLETRTIRRRIGKGKKRRTVVTHETIDFADGASWARYGRSAGFDTRGAWRRANVSDFVASLYREVKARKPWVLVGISPFGVWRPGYPAGLTGLDSYTEIYADSRRWLREGWLDYLAPQLYWPLNGDERRFTRLDEWWRGENVAGRHVWPGLLTMRVASRGAPWSASEIPSEIAWMRDARQGTAATQGHFHFRLGPMTPSGPLGQRLRESYAEPALPPASAWLGEARPATPVVDGCVADMSTAAAPAAPAPLRVTKDGPVAALPADGAMAPTPRAAVAAPGLRLRADASAGDGPASAPVRWWVVQLRDAAGRWTTQTLAGDLTVVPMLLPDGARARIAAVTAVSPTGVLGRAAVVRLD